jgi:hypothetical protein
MEKAPIAEHSFDHLDFIDFSYSRYLNRSHWQGRSIQAPLRLFL